jgi:hypothetical protein
VRVFLIVLILGLSLSWSQILPKPDSLQRNTSIAVDTIDINADEYNTQFILGNPLSEDSVEIKQQIESRSFAADPFFMRNIDREEFEQERAFLQFVGDEAGLERRKAKRAAFVPFPDPSTAKSDSPESKGSAISGRLLQNSVNPKENQPANQPSNTKNTNSLPQNSPNVDKSAIK